jgi:2-methylisocitrate lyase-like PEP mutase family enzyme
MLYMKKTTALHRAIMARRAVVVPGCHDALSAKVIEACGFEAIQISGYGLAASILGKPDVGLVQMKGVLDTTWNIAQATNIPVMADVDTGGGNAVNAAWITERLIAMGVAGMNIEDQVFPKRCGHMAGKEVIAAEEMTGKVQACADTRKRLDKDFIINARTDVFSVHGLKEAIRRCNLYLEAGADLAFIDGIKTKADIKTAVKPALGQSHGRNFRDEDGAGAYPRIGRDGRGPRLNPRGLDHGRAQGADQFLYRPEAVAHRHSRRADEMGFVF